jgi:hypothetical protein
MTHPALVSLTMFEAAGPRGVMSEKGIDFPMTEVFRKFLHATHIFSTTIAEPQARHRPVAIQALGLQDSSGNKSILLANLSGDSQDVELSAEQRRISLPPQSVITFSC